jgi:mRNA interferase RelE/StbE
LRTYRVLLSETTVRQLRDMPQADGERMKRALGQLEEDPFRPRSGVDIKRLRGPGRDYHGLRVGDHRAIYVVEEDRVLVAKVIRRSKAYRWLD